MKELAKKIVERFVQLPSESSGGVENDRVHVYAKEMLTLGLLWHGFHDAIKEGDGDRILKLTTHRNYAKEAVNVLYQYYYVFSERQKSQLLWSRCVNTRGYAGCNIPCDLHMEHLNRRLKTVIRSMGANVSPSRVERAGRAIHQVQKLCEVFERQTARRLTSDTHSDTHPYPSFGKDFSAVFKCLLDEQVFKKIPDRFYPSFSFNKSIFAISTKELNKKIERSLSQLSSLDLIMHLSVALLT